MAKNLWATTSQKYTSVSRFAVHSCGIFCDAASMKIQRGTAAQRHSGKDIVKDIVESTIKRQLFDKSHNTNVAVSAYQSSSRSVSVTTIALG
jgi:hypothetical protein